MYKPGRVYKAFSKGLGLQETKSNLAPKKNKSSVFWSPKNGHPIKTTSRAFQND